MLLTLFSIFADSQRVLKSVSVKHRFQLLFILNSLTEKRHSTRLAHIPKVRHIVGELVIQQQYSPKMVDTQ